MIHGEARRLPVGTVLVCLLLKKAGTEVYMVPLDTHSLRDLSVSLLLSLTVKRQTEDSTLSLQSAWWERHNPCWALIDHLVHAVSKNFSFYETHS